MRATWFRTETFVWRRWGWTTESPRPPNSRACATLPGARWRSAHSSFPPASSTLPKKYISPWRKNLSGLDGDSDEIGWDYETTDGYLLALETNGVGLNESYLVPHGNIRMEAMGLDNRKPTPAELASMRDITRREMEVGAFGLSTGLIYMPCAYAETAELIELCKVVAEFDGAFVVHQRSEADTILASMEEVIEIGRRSGAKIHFSHFKVCGRKNWPLIDQALALRSEEHTSELQSTMYL